MLLSAVCTVAFADHDAPRGWGDGRGHDRRERLQERRAPPPVRDVGPRMSPEERRALRDELREQRDAYWRQRQEQLRGRGR